MVTQAPVSDVRLFTVEDVERMFEAGILDADERVELLEGQIFVRPRESPEHQSRVGLLQRALNRAYAGEEFWIRFAAAATVDDYSLPEPDIAVVRAHPADFSERHPRCDELVLAVEVARTTVARDRGQKARIYAGAGCPVYWVVDLTRREVVVHEGPRPDGTWASVRTHVPGEEVALPQSGVTVPVTDILP
jgi:Uma2 family endonuclease